MDEEIVVVATYPSISEAALHRGVLEAAGIAAEIFTDDMGGMYPQMQNITGVRLMVRREDLERAREVLASGHGDDRS